MVTGQPESWRAATKFSTHDTGRSSKRIKSTNGNTLATAVKGTSSSKGAMHLALLKTKVNSRLSRVYDNISDNSDVYPSDALEFLNSTFPNSFPPH